MPSSNQVGEVLARVEGAHRWKVVPLSSGQLTDVRPEDVLADGLYRKCETYRGGGGYDQFPVNSERRLGYRHHLQFIVQLFGCNLDCPYCYVTREGVWGAPVKVTTGDLVAAFIEAHKAHDVTVFHLMGGAPALQLRHWPELIEELARRCDFDWIFHSDMLLTEGVYDKDVLAKLTDHPRVLLAVDIKGLTAEEHLRNTRKPLDWPLLCRNLDMIELYQVPYYLTFTAVADQEPFWDQFRSRWPGRYAERRNEAFAIDLINYDALPYVDRVPWGRALANQETDRNTHV